MTDANRKRAPRGNGSIKQRKNGRWAWSIEFQNPHTKEPVRIDRERRTREEALDAGHLALTRYNLQQQRKAVAIPGTVAAWYNTWLRMVLARADGSPNTYTNYEGHVRRRIIPSIGQMRMSDVTTDDMKALLDVIPQLPNRAAVHKTLARGWHEAFNAQKVTDPDVVKRAPVKPDTCATSPVARATTQEEATARMLAVMANPPTLVRESMRAADQTAIFRALEKERLRARFVAAVVTGPRQSESLGWAWPFLVRPGQPGQVVCTAYTPPASGTATRTVATNSAPAGRR